MEEAGRLGAQDEVSRAFRYYLRVRYIECDAQKVVFNSRYGEYVDVSITEFLRAAGVLDEFLEGALDFQLVKQTIEWKARDVCISSTANSIASRSRPRLMAFCIAETQAIAGSPCLVSGIIGPLRRA